MEHMLFVRKKLKVTQISRMKKFSNECENTE